MNQPARKTVSLYHLGYIGLIIPCASGVVYSNLVGGEARRQETIEGVFVPLNNNLWGGKSDINQKLRKYFIAVRLAGRCTSGLDAEAAAFIQGQIAEHVLLQRLQVKIDQARLASSWEAWVHVTFDNADYPDVFDGFESKSGILTWLNSAETQS